MERIRDRYESDASFLDLFEDFDHDAETARSNNKLQSTNSKKLTHPVIPNKSSQPYFLYVSDNSVRDAPQVKRRGSRLPGGSSIDPDNRYAQSSEWSCTDDNTVEVPKTVIKTRTYIEID